MVWLIQEGWGAVVNEAMNSGCAVVADHMIGAAPWLIRQGENGRTGSAERRATLQRELGLPARLTANGLLEALDLLLTREEFDAL